MEIDERTTTLQQRHIFKNRQDDIDPEVLKKYNWYKSKECKVRGREKLANAIVNAHVPRDSTWSGNVRTHDSTLRLPNSATFIAFPS